jgi:hypothetical protein
MDPVNKSIYAYNLNKCILQTPDVIVYNNEPVKKFSLDPPEKSEKSKKDLDKKKKDKKDPKGE